jgi:periplasmic protein TonB
MAQRDADSESQKGEWVMAATATMGVPAYNLKKPLWFSVALHVALTVLLVVSGYYSRTGESWGGAGGAISVGLVGNVPGIPMPRPDTMTPNRVVDESKGLYKSEPPPEVKTTPPDAESIPKFLRNKPPKYISKPSKVLENKTVPPPNAVPYGQGGAPTVPYASFSMGAGNTQGGMSFGGQGGGDFGARFPWYVEAVQRRVSSNWLQSTVDPGISFAPRVVATFDILRNGTIVNAQITKSSGNYSVDNSALRAIQNSSPVNALPPEYSGSKVSVEFWFEFHRQ